MCVCACVCVCVCLCDYIRLNVVQNTTVKSGQRFLDNMKMMARVCKQFTSHDVVLHHHYYTCSAVMI